MCLCTYFPSSSAMDQSHKLYSISTISLIFLLLSIFTYVSHAKPKENLETYIIHVHKPPSLASIASFDERRKWYNSFLPVTTASSSSTVPRMIYPYKNIISGFAAKLSKRELLDLKKKSGFVHAYKDRAVRLHTTHTPNFLGLHRDTPGFWNDSNYGKGVIIGIFDTGVAPDHPSFRDEGMPPPPAKWKGECEFNASLCNNKLIGARNFAQGLKAMQSSAVKDGPHDNNGHGSHTASTAAGMFVQNANIDDQANGTASGTAPFAHLAIYKVCNEEECANSDILAGMDAAIEDGVDIMSISLGSDAQPFDSDVIATASFAAIEKGIFVSCSAGNYGPAYGTVTNDAPWILTVGASTIDREIRTTVELRSKARFNGESTYQPKGFKSNLLPLTDASYCVNGSLSGIDVKGKVVLCDDGNSDWVEKGEVVKNAGGAAMIIANYQGEGVTVPALSHVLPASHVSYTNGMNIKSYIYSNKHPKATITFEGTVLGISPAPVVASFSSRGPSQIDKNILKPDIIGPGVNILAAWPDSSTNFNILSGTSMSAPHLSGIAALLKSVHPDWSPAAIKSAIMTTAYLKANNGNQIADENLDPANLFATGAGHVNPSKASNPGLIYDISPDDYITHLCGLGYSNRQMTAIAHRAIKCSKTQTVSVSELNYPSFMVSLSSSNNYTVTVKRTVTNVGTPDSSYEVQISPPIGVSMTVEPQRLVFAEVNEQAQFRVSITSRNNVGGGVAYLQGSIAWVSSDSITVNSPIMVAVK